MRKAVLLLACVAAGTGCGPMRKADRMLTDANRSGADPAPAEVPQTPRQAAKKESSDAKIARQIADYYARVKPAGPGYDPDLVVFVVNGVLVGAPRGNQKTEVPYPDDGVMTVSVLNGGTVSLANAEIGFYAEGGRYADTGSWTAVGEEVWYWCHSPINPANVGVEPVSLFTAPNAFNLQPKRGSRKAMVRLKSFDRPELVRTFTLK